MSCERHGAGAETLVLLGDARRSQVRRVAHGRLLQVVLLDEYFLEDFALILIAHDLPAGFTAEVWVAT